MIGVQTKVVVIWKGAGLTQAARGAIVPVVAGVTFACAEFARAGCPVDTGELQGSIYGEADGMSGSVRATAGHAVPVEVRTPYLYPALMRAASLAQGLLGGASI